MFIPKIDMWFLKKLSNTRVPVMLARLIFLFVIYALCRVIFYYYNRSIIGTPAASELWGVIKASLVFDSGSIFYVNILFIVMWLLPFDFVERRGWQRLVTVMFMIFNSVALLVDIADIFYFQYKLARIASDDIHYLSEPTAGKLFGSMLIDYWQGTLIWIGLCVLMYLACFRVVRYRGGENLLVQRGVRYFVRTFWLALFTFLAVLGIRGYRTDGDRFPINVSDAAMFVRPELSQLVLSNPFCVIRTWGNKLEGVRYMSTKSLDETYRPIHSGAVPDSLTRLIAVDTVLTRPRLPENTNIVILVLESFGKPHIKSLNPSFPATQPSYTPFLDSLFGEGLLFTEGYQGGIRSIDAMPAIWASIPSYNKNFMRLPQSQAEYYAMPRILDSLGYTTAFMHGASRGSMSFAAFGAMTGIERFVSREDYEQIYGPADFDGKWGIWDDKFLPFALENIDTMPQPFMTTIFTLSSHEPFKVPPHMEGRFEDGKLPIHRVIRYSDYALGQFFGEASKKPWFDKTLFIIVADHGSGAEDELLRVSPYSHTIPIFFYMPSAGLKGVTEQTVSHLDIMPTLLPMLGVDESYVAFGHDAFDPASPHFAAGYYDGTYGITDGDLFYQFSESGLISLFNIKADPQKKIDIKERADPQKVRLFEAYIQQYYRTVAARAFTPESWEKEVAQ